MDDLQDDPSVPEPSAHVAADVREAVARVHAELGAGLPPDVHRLCLAIELGEMGCSVETDVPYPVTYRGQRVGIAFRADLIVDSRVLVDVLSVGGIEALHRRRMRTYLSLSGYDAGVLVDVEGPDPEDAVEALPP